MRTTHDPIKTPNPTPAPPPITRRAFILSTATAACAATIPSPARAATATRLPFPLVDLHVHLDNSTIDDVLKLSAERGVKFGIVEHAGTKENKYPVVLGNDDELRRYLKMLDGKPVYKGVQAEWTDWMTCFSKQALAGLDYVLTDAMTFPDKNGRPRKLWEKDADLGDPRTFMDRYVDWYVHIMRTEPIDILANLTWLPAQVAADYDALWTPARMQKVIDTARKHEVALEISASMRLPKPPFLTMAKDAGAKLTFGSNGRYPNMGKLDYAVQMAKSLHLTPANMFLPPSTKRS
ncbi:MAG: hypothetical protein JXQ73_12860 [Phycisphaerae bacterium]|nr:hypothetical protein [Phycisphaerae bacterium]